MSEADEIRGWFAGRIPNGWFEAAPDVATDREEILVVGRLADPQLSEATPDAIAAARGARIRRFREETREERIRIAQEGQRRFGRVVSWGARCGDVEELFTTLAMPTMTRLRLPERRLLDALVDSGVARSRAHALAWCVRLVAKHEADWVKQLNEAVEHVREMRSGGPQLN